MFKSNAEEFEEIDASQLETLPDINESSLILESNFIDIAVDDKIVKIYTEQVTRKDNKKGLDILFLHGMRFTSKNWLDIKTLHHVASWGHRAVAVDLPGFGKSICIMEPEVKGIFLKHLISALGLNQPVIVSPSMSGEFSLPFLFEDPASSTDRAVGFIPVAPVLTSKFINQMKKSQIPTLIIVGTKDTVNGRESTQDLRNLNNSWYAPIEGASHPCYLDNPDAFHRLLFWFLKGLK